MLHLENVTKIYNKGKENECLALKDVSLALPDKGFVFIEGKSGSGKSTLLNILAGIDCPTEGKVENDFGENSCAMVFQDFQLIDFLTLEENLRLGMELSAKQTERFDELVEKYGLQEVLNHYPNQVSGGQKQRTALLRALLQERTILFCDEPTGNLDEENSKSIAALLKDEAESKLVVVVSHDAELFLPLCTRHIKLQNKTVEQDEDFSAPSQENVAQADVREKTNVPKLSWKTKGFLSWRFFKKSLVKNLLTLFSLFLSFLLLVSSVNGLMNTKGTVLYNVYKEANIRTIDIAVASDHTSEGVVTMSQAEYQRAAKKYDVVSRFVLNRISMLPQDGSFEGNRLYTQKLYLSDRCDRTMLCGDAEIEQGEILLSDYLANVLIEGCGLTNYDDLLGKIVGEGDGLRVSGVFKTDAPMKGDDTLYELEYLQCVAYMTEDTYTHYNLGDSSYVYFEYGDKYTHSSDIVYRGHAPHMRNPYGDWESPLKEDEIGISLGVAKAYLKTDASFITTEDAASLIGKEIEITYCNPRLNPHAAKTDRLDRMTRKYTVKYVYSPLSTDEVFLDLPEAEYDEIVPLYDSQHYRDAVWGISVQNYTKAQLNDMVSKGYTDQSYFSYSLNEGISWFRSLAWLEAGVGVVLLLISIAIICNHVLAAVEKEKRVFGVLTSLGLKPKEVTLVYLSSLFVAILLCALLVSFAQIAVVYVMNVVAMSKRFTPLKSLFYEPLSVVCLFLLCVGLLGILYVAVTKRLQRKQIVDVIYER